jgi:hypothetical protein
VPHTTSLPAPPHSHSHFWIRQKIQLMSENQHRHSLAQLVGRAIRAKTNCGDHYSELLSPDSHAATHVPHDASRVACSGVFHSYDHPCQYTSTSDSPPAVPWLQEWSYHANRYFEVLDQQSCGPKRRMTFYRSAITAASIISYVKGFAPRMLHVEEFHLCFRPTWSQKATMTYAQTHLR